MIFLSILLVTLHLMLGTSMSEQARHGGIAAVPLNQHGHPTFTRDTDGVPLCPMGLRMQPKFQFNHTNGDIRTTLLLPTLVS
jgi:hypothetical protein